MKAISFFPSRSVGLILTGNEISQISLALFLSYVGGQRNRPKWIACGMVFSAFSCFILALPHFIYGAGDEASQYTKEYGSKFEVSQSLQCCTFSLSKIFKICSRTLFVECIIGATIKIC